ncbi:MAG: hypothetical protein K6G40_03190 [Eubacterium sp.]|nr:hypothetical protein [Eubacterium sp.]
MLKGVFKAEKKDGTIYYRSNIVYKNKHISLGSYNTENEAHKAYTEAYDILVLKKHNFENAFTSKKTLDFKRLVSLYNFRDNGMYIKTPIYLKDSYFSYYLDDKTELKFDIDDLFYFSSHTILRRGSHLFVNDYGMQLTILSRFGLKPYSVIGRDYEFNNGDIYDFRYSNITIKNLYHGVIIQTTAEGEMYRSQIHINGYIKLGLFNTPEEAAICYNKAVDFLKENGKGRNYPTNYIIEMSPKVYADIYTRINLPELILLKS